MKASLLALVVSGTAACSANPSASVAKPTQPGRIWFVAPTTRPPLDLTSLLTSPQVKPGDTIMLRGGTYRLPDRSDNNLGFLIKLKGEKARPITIQAAPGQRAIIDGGLTDKDGLCAHVRIRDLEILVSENLERAGTSTQKTSWPTDLKRPAGGVNLFTADDVKVINNVIHHNSVGVSMWGPVSGNSEVYGNLIYENGWIGPDRHHGHGIYMQNSSVDWKYVVENVIFNNFDLNVQIYGSPRATIAQIAVARNVVYSGDNTEDGRLLIGGYAPFRRVKALDNVLYRAALQVGYDHKGGDDAVVKGNTVWKSDVYIESINNNITKLSAANNLAWPANRAAAIDGSPVAVTKPRITLRPNAYDKNRALLSILNFGGAATVDVDFAGFLRVGDSFELRAPHDFYGAARFVGTYDGKPIALRLRDDFAAFIVLRR